MSTRGTYGFRSAEKTAETYKHGDAYPSWTGVRILGYCRTHTVAQMKSVLAKLKLVGRDYVPTPEEIESHAYLADTRVSSGELTETYVLIRKAQADLAVYDNPGVFLFLDDRDIYHAEVWDWVIDLDREVLEVSKEGEVICEYPLADLPSDEELIDDLGEY